MPRNFRFPKTDRRVEINPKIQWRLAAERSEAVSYDFTKSENWRWGSDSNRRCPFGHAAFQVRCVRPLCHPTPQGHIIRKMI